MRIVVKKQNVALILTAAERAKLFANGSWKTAGMRAVIDAGRKTKTQVQTAVAGQMNIASGTKRSYVIANTRGTPRRATLSFDIYGVRGGISIENYSGLRVLGQPAPPSGGGQMPGMISSDVWNNPRIFKRSFEGNKGGYFAILPGGSRSSKAPQAMWTYGNKPNQPRQANGQFGKSKMRYGKIRRLAGPSLMKEIPQGASLATFQRVAPLLLEQAAMRHIFPLLR